jgi:glycosyltransferase involved in cell wall biosynthesis
MQIRHIYWFAYFNLDEPSVRYRAAYPLAHLEAQYGITYDLVHPGYDRRSLIRFARAYLGALLFRRRDSVIVVQKLFTRGFYAWALKWLFRIRREGTLYDIDDAEYVRRPPATMHFFMRQAAQVAAGSQTLIDDARAWNAHVSFLGSPVIPHGLQANTRRDRLCIGWIGYYGAHRENLQRCFFPALRDLGFPVRLKLLGVTSAAQYEELQAYFQDQPHVQLDIPLDLDWHDEAGIYADIQDFDIGVAPLLDTHFNRAKSAFKLKQCLSCGVPVLASPVGENVRYLDHGRNGYLCDGPAEFKAGIMALAAADEVAFSRMQAAALATAEAFSLADYCARLLAMVGDERATLPVPTHPQVKMLANGEAAT